MMGLLRIIRGASFWLPVLGTIACSAIIGALLTDPTVASPDNQPSCTLLAVSSSLLRFRTQKRLSKREKNQQKKKPPISLPRSQPIAAQKAAAALPGQSPQLEQVISRTSSPHTEKPVSGPIARQKLKALSFANTLTSVLPVSPAVREILLKRSSGIRL